MVGRILHDGLAVYGHMQIDVADVIDASFHDNDETEGVVLHEMGHVLGLGGAWKELGLVDATQQNYIGEEGVRVWREDLGCGNGNPPIEQDGGSGSEFVHFDEAALGNELMTSQLSPTMPMSKLTIAALKDQGYPVDMSQADPYCPPPTGDYCCTCNASCQRYLRHRELEPSDSNGQGHVYVNGANDNGKPPLTAAGKARANSYGVNALKKAGIFPDMDGIQGEIDYVTVIYKENGHLYDVQVSADD